MGLVLVAGCAGDVRPPPGPGEPRAEVGASAPRPVDAPARGYVGVIVARNRSDVSSSVAGELTSIAVRAGDRVEAGAVLAIVDSSPLEREIGVARAELQGARSARTSAAVDLEEANERRARLDRIGDQVAAEVVGAEQGAAIRYSARRARAALGRAEAEVRRHQRRIALLEGRRTRTRVVAPFAGLVASRYLDPGAVIDAGEPIVRLIESDEPWVRFAVPPARASELTVGADVEVEVGARRLRARVVQVAPEIDPIAAMVVVEARIEDGERGLLRSGTGVRVMGR
jgi:RND family efflux transporter MFP subunit